jgi:putative DNA methylase
MMGIPINCKRLVEVDFPIVAVSEASAKEKDIKTGSFAAVHVWWARRPLAACRAMNMACMIPDPADANCPTELRRVIAAALDELERAPHGMQKKLQVTKRTWEVDDDGDLSASRNRPESLKRRLLRFIGEYSRWDLKMSETHTKCARSIIIGCHNGNPKLLDSFAGGGSIPIEGQRIGMEAYASDINPIPLLLNRLQLELLPNITENFLNELKQKAIRINEALKQEVESVYPIQVYSKIDEVPIGFLCARQIICEGIDCGIKFPLISSPWVAKSSKNKVCYSFKRDGDQVAVGLINNPNLDQIPEQTCKRGDAKCPICNYVTPVKSVRKQLTILNGGTNESRLLVTITTPKNGTGRIFNVPTSDDIDARNRSANKLLDYLNNNPELSMPDEPMPPQGSLGMRVQGYGMTNWGAIYTHRQALTNLVLCNEVKKEKEPLARVILALTASKFNDRNSSLCMWSPPHMKFLPTFKSHRMQMTWDFFEPCPFGNLGSNYLTTFENVLRGIRAAMTPNGGISGNSAYGDATNHFMPDDSIDLWATDPPYYDSVPYSDISNYFVVWLKRMLPDLVLEDQIAPKLAELVMDKSAIADGKKDSVWYESSVERALREGCRLTKSDGIAYWVYAHKSTEGWSTVLKGVIKSGWKVTGSWPISTERKSRFRAQNSAALSTSVHIVMRPRPDDAGVGEWSVILNNLSEKLSAWLTRMKDAGVMGADAIYSCIGPAMELFSKYDSVERASGEGVDIDEYLQYVWDSIADEAVKLLSPDSEQSAAEPDARFSLMAIWTLRQSANVDYVSGDTLDEEEIEVASEPSKLTIPFDTASLLARGIGAVIEDLEKSEVIDVKGGIVEILSPENRRHYLLGVTNGASKVQQKSSGGIQIKLGESWEEAEARVDVETKQKGLIEMPKRDSQLDKLHQAMLLHADGNSVALEAHLRDNIGDDPMVWQLANTLNTLFPEGSWERSKIEGVIARYQSLR